MPKSTGPPTASDPVEWSHPLNRGRLGWWLALPHLAGSTAFYDLLRRAPGALTNMTASAWRATDRPGGWRHVAFDGADDHIQIPTGLVPLPQQHTLAAWVRIDVLGSTYHQFLSCGNYNGELRYDAGNMVLEYVIGRSSAYLSLFYPLAAGTWYRVVGATDTASSTLYVNGVQVSQIAASSVTDVVGLERIGRRFDDVFPLNGSIDDVGVWSRGLSPAEVGADYRLSSAGYPGVLRRSSRAVAGTQADAATGGGLRMRAYPRGINRGLARGVV